MLFVALLACVSNDMVRPLYDQDGDGFYAPEAAAIGETGPFDCDDGDPAAFPGATETCDGRDDDCDGAVDEDAADRGTWFLDADGDGYGDPAAPTEACAAPDRYVADGSDCDDLDPAVNPDTTWYADADGDGFGTTSSVTTSCARPYGFAGNADDCDDTTALAHPGGEEDCEDGIDGDCDGFEVPCGLSGTRSLADASARFRSGSTSRDGLGAAEAVGDFDGDGVDDLLAGVLLYDDAPGGVALVPGSPALVLGDRTLGASYALWSATEIYRAFAVGDFDRDGRDDVLLGVMDDTGPGSARLVYGGAFPATGDLSSSPALRGVRDGDRAAWTMTAGDVDGDGYDDMVVGARQAGAVYFVLGDKARRTADLSLADADGSVADASGRSAGATLAAGDVDGDGLADVAIGTGPCCRGPAWVVLGDKGGLAGEGSLDDADVQIGLFDGVTDFSTVVAVGDVDGDGYADVLDAAEDATTGAGAAWLFPGGPALAGAVSTSEAVATFAGFTADSDAAAPVGLEDVDGDGLADVVLGSPGDDVAAADAGAVYVFPGLSSGANTTSSAEISVLGTSADGRAGCSFAVGDLDDDGAPDLLVGGDGDYVAPGSLWLLYGR